MSADLSASAVQAKRMLRDRDTDGAFRCLRAGLEQDPTDRDAQEILGTLLFRLKRHEEARDAFQQLTRIDPRYAGAWVNLGAVLNTLGDHRKASDALRRAIQRDKNCAVAYYNLGIAQKGLNQLRMAVFAYQGCIQRDPASTDAWTNLGNLHMQLKDFPKAVKAFESGLEQSPNSEKLKGLLAHAKEAVEENRREDSPFGRLVAEEELAGRQTRTQRRTLTVQDRNRERELMRKLVRNLRRAIRPMVTILDDRLPQKLHTLHLAAASDDARGEGTKTLDQLTDAIGELQSLRETVSHTVAEIRSHLKKTDPQLS